MRIQVIIPGRFHQSLKITNGLIKEINKKKFRPYFNVLDEINLLPSMTKGGKQRQVYITNAKVITALKNHLDKEMEKEKGRLRPDHASIVTTAIYVEDNPNRLKRIAMINSPSSANYRSDRSSTDGFFFLTSTMSTLSFYFTGKKKIETGNKNTMFD